MVQESFAFCISRIAPIYNLVFSLIVFYLLFRLVTLKKKSKKVFIKPWYFLFAALSVFVLEEIITLMKFFNVISDAIIPRWFNAVFELIMVILFIYMLFMQINHVAKKKSF